MILLEPLIWNRSMHLRVFKRGRHAVCTDEMFLRNEKSRARAGPPLGRVLELLGGMIEFHRDWRRQCTFSPPRFLRHQAVAELNGVPRNQDEGNQQEERRRDQYDAIVLRLNPLGHVWHNEFLTTNRHEQKREPRITRISRIGRDRLEDQEY